LNKLGIWAIAIVAAFVVVILSANPVVEAAGGWKAAIEDLQNQIDNIELLEGPQGDKGDTGDTGPQGLTPTYWEIVDIFGNEGIVLCDLGDKIISGGVKIRAGSSSLQGNEPIFNVGPNSDQEGWFGQIKSPGSQLRVSANCLDNAPLRP